MFIIGRGLLPDACALYPEHGCGDCGSQCNAEDSATCRWWTPSRGVNPWKRRPCEVSIGDDVQWEESCRTCPHALPE